MVPAGVTARAGALGAERGLFLPRRAPHPRAQVGQTPLPFLPRLLLDLQAHAPPSALGCWAEGPGTLGQLRPQEWSGPVGWALASGLARVVPLRAAGKALPWAPQQGLEGWFPGSHCFLCVCSHSHGSRTVPARRPPLLASTLPSRGRGKAQEPASGDSHPGGWGRAAWGPLPGARAAGAQAQGGRPPRRRALPALLVDRALAGSGPGPGAACWGPGPAHLSPGAAPFVAPPPASVALGRGGSGTVRYCQVPGLLGLVPQPV